MTTVQLCRLQGPPGEGPQNPPEMLFQRDLHNRFTRSLEKVDNACTEEDYAVVTGDDGNDDDDKISTAAVEPVDELAYEKISRTLTHIFAKVYILRPEIEQIRRPVGSRPNQSRSCRDLWLAHPDSTDGWYWVDPNWGVPDDAVRVFCGMRAGGETSVLADGVTDSARLSWWPASASAASNASSWFSRQKGGFRLRYRTVGDVQLRFLSLLSTGEYRNFTFVCNNVNAWYSQRTKDHARALRFRGRNEAQMSFAKDSPTVPVDDCQGY
ncbi:collagen alpha-1(V) chain-like [Amblyomma americanum]